MLSLNSRLLLAASLVLTGFLGLTGWVLDQAFRDSAEAAVRDRLQGHLYAVIAGSDLKSNGIMVFPQELPEARFSTPGSGLYAQIASHDGKQLWRSASAVGMEIPYPQRMPRGTSRFERLAASGGGDLFTYSFGLAWELKRKEVAFTFSVAESTESFHNQIASFRKSLWGWLGGATLFLLAVQGSILRWSLSPLRHVADDLQAIEQGQSTHLEGRYPKELRGLTNNLNALIRSEREHLNRYRNTLSDLAHSLKTPLAVLQSTVDNPAGIESQRALLGEQVERMRQIVDYQLQKAATSGRMTLVAPVPVQEICAKLVASLQKVHADRALACKIDVPADVLFAGDKGDLMELLGNVIENAFKWCKKKVHVTARSEGTVEGRRSQLTLVIEDDGPGFPDERARAVLQRGVRADEQVPGHGIGLAVVKDIVELYNGKLAIGRSKLGGAKITVTL